MGPEAMKENKATISPQPASLAGVEVLSFSEMCERIDFNDFEASVERLIRRLDRNGVRIDCTFPRPAPARINRIRPAYTHYRWEVQNIPLMDRHEERLFCMGIELLWMRLQRARRAAGFAKDDVGKQPGLYENPC